MHRRHHHHPERHSVRLRIAAVALLCAASATSANAQRRSRSQFPPELRGSKASVQKMWDFAVDHGLTFYRTPADVDQAVAAGKLVQLTGDSTYELSRGVGFSYATKEARQFVLGFAPQYRAACGTPLMVTSAARPTSRQPRNANPYSVHPTGIAIDIRRPPAGPCQRWLRGALAQLEDQGLVEATEERHPVHVHVAVLTPPGTVASLPLLGSAGTPSSVARASSPVPPQAVHISNPPEHTAAAANGEVEDRISESTYRVREGDTLWEIARRSGVSVSDLARANRRSQRSSLRPGVVLRIPR
jgi:nucleoid-associated protein YgaU